MGHQEGVFHVRFVPIADINPSFFDADSSWSISMPL